MNPPPAPVDDAQRVQLLHELRLPELAGTDDGLQAIARLASLATGSLIGAVSFVGDKRQWFHATVGLPPGSAPRDQAFCAHLLEGPDLFTVDDAQADPCFSHAPAIDGESVRFYAGVAIRVHGYRLGAVCCMDVRPRELDAHSERTLRDLATVAGALLGQRWSALHGDAASSGPSRLAPGSSDERWRLAVESGDQGVWDWDADEGGLYFSDAWKSLLGYSRHEVGSHVREWLSRIHPEDLPQAKALLAAHLRGDTPLYVAEHRMRHKDGRDIWVLNSGKVMRRTAAGRASRIIGTLIDVTSQRHAEKSLGEQRAAQLVHVAKSEFLSRLSHEMRTPLNAVIGFTQVLLNRADAPDANEVRLYAEHVLHAGERLLAMTNDVLDLQHVEEGRLRLDMADVAIDRVVAEVVAELTPAADERGVRLENLVIDGIAARADETRLRQVLRNIASNAVKFNRPAGVVRWTVDVDSTSGRVRLCTQDTGGGLKPQQLERLFQPFERLGRETSAIEGSGLGLIIARSLAVAMGGQLVVQSRVGVGTQVMLELPMARQSALPFDAPEHDPAEQPPASPDDAAALLRLLYVEDNRINAILFEEAIRLRDDVELRVAEDPAEAFEQIRDWTPDVLVLDAHLPEMDGFELLDALRQRPGLEEIPAFMCSADALPEDVRRAEAAGFVGFWSKPINIARIMLDIDGLARTRSAASASKSA